MSNCVISLSGRFDWGRPTTYNGSWDSGLRDADTTSPITRLLKAWESGDAQARDDLVPLVYRELRRRAAAYLRRERRDHTLQPTALVHEAFVRLIGHERVTWQNRAQFFGVSAKIMRRI